MASFTAHMMTSCGTVLGPQLAIVGQALLTDGSELYAYVTVCVLGH